MKTLNPFCLAIMALPLLGNLSFATEHQLKMPPDCIAAKDRWSAAGLADYQFTFRQDGDSLLLSGARLYRAASERATHSPRYACRTRSSVSRSAPWPLRTTAPFSST